jgi:hypothetical protein
MVFLGPLRRGSSPTGPHPLSYTPFPTGHSLLITHSTIRRHSLKYWVSLNNPQIKNGYRPLKWSLPLWAIPTKMLHAHLISTMHAKCLTHLTRQVTKSGRSLKVVTKAHRLYSILKQLNPIHIIATHFLKIYILISCSQPRLGFRKASFPKTFLFLPPDCKIVHYSNDIGRASWITDP